MSLRGMVTVPSELKIILFSCFTKNNFAKSCFKATVEMTIQGEKQPFHITPEKLRADHKSQKCPLPPFSNSVIALR